MIFRFEFSGAVRTAKLHPDDPNYTATQGGPRKLNLHSNWFRKTTLCKIFILNSIFLALKHDEMMNRKRVGKTFWVNSMMFLTMMNLTARLMKKTVSTQHVSSKLSINWNDWLWPILIFSDLTFANINGDDPNRVRNFILGNGLYYDFGNELIDHIRRHYRIRKSDRNQIKGKGKKQI